MEEQGGGCLATGRSNAGELLARVEKLEGQLAALKRRQSPVRILEELSNDAGLLEAGEFRSGNGVEPGEGFSGGRFGFPGFVYAGLEFFLVGVAGDAAQVGLSLADGTLYFGGGAGRLNADGLVIRAADSPAGANKVSFSDQAGSLLLGELYSDEAGADPAFHLNTYYPVRLPAGFKGGLRVLGDLDLAGGLVRSGPGFVGLGAATTLTIAPGGGGTRVVSATRSYHRVDTAGGAASDSLTNILGGSEGDLLVLRSVDAGRDPTLVDQAGGAGQMFLAGNFTLTQTTDTLTLLHIGTGWLELSRSDNN